MRNEQRAIWHDRIKAMLAGLPPAVGGCCDVADIMPLIELAMVNPGLAELCDTLAISVKEKQAGWHDTQKIGWYIGDGLAVSRRFANHPDPDGEYMRKSLAEFGSQWEANWIPDKGGGTLRIYMIDRESADREAREREARERKAA